MAVGELAYRSQVGADWTVPPNVAGGDEAAGAADGYVPVAGGAVELAGGATGDRVPLPLWTIDGNCTRCPQTGT